MKNRAALITILMVIAPMVLSADVRVTFYSVPEGATLTSGGQAWGTTPVTLNYKTPRRWRGCVNLSPVTVRWVSGAEASLEALQACSENGNRQEVRFTRPSGVDGLEADIQYASHLQQMAMFRQQMAAQQAANQQAYWQQQMIASQQRWLAIQAQIRAMRTVRCTSNQVGLTVYTNCY